MGIGVGSSRPTFNTDSAIDLFDLTGARIELNNLRFIQGTTTPSTALVNVGAAGCKIKTCDFPMGTNDPDGITVPDAGDDLLIESCTFSVSAEGPNAGIRIESATTLGIKVIGCSFNANNVDWDDAAIHSAVAHLNYLYQDITLTNGADIVHTAASKGWSSNITVDQNSCVKGL